MRKCRILTLCFAIAGVAFAVKAENPQGERNISAGVNAYGGVGGYDKNVRYGFYANPEDYMRYWGLEFEGSYRLKLYRAMQVRPALSLYYERHHGLREVVDGPSWPDENGNIIFGKIDYGKSHLNEFGMQVALPVGLSFKVPSGSLEVETGPVFGLYFVQHNTKAKHAVDEDNMFRRCKWRWHFGARYNFGGGRFYAKVAYDLAMSNYVSYDMGEAGGYFKQHITYKCRDVLYGGIGINF